MAEGVNSSIMATFQCAMESIVTTRLRNTFNMYTPKCESSQDRIQDYLSRGETRSEDNQTSQPGAVISQLNMGIIGCLPDNVQKAIQSFSIKPGQQYLTVAFPFMEELMRSHSTHLSDSTDLHNELTGSMYIDIGPEVLSGFRSISTMVLNRNRTSLAVVLLTLFEVKSTEGILKHFDSSVRIMVHPNTPITLWKHPLCVIDIEGPMREAIFDVIVEAILDVQNENIQRSCPGKSRKELFKQIKEQQIAPQFCSYGQHFHRCLKRLAALTTTSDHRHLVDLLDHIRSSRCSVSDFHKVDAYFKASGALTRTFWSVFGHEQLAPKLFPPAKAVVGNKCLQLSCQTARSQIFRGDVPVAHVSIKEGLKNIFDTLKLQESGEKASNTLVNTADYACGQNIGPFQNSLDRRAPSLADKNNTCWDRSAFYRPNKTARPRHSTTPYSDALKAVAVTPYSWDDEVIRKSRSNFHNRLLSSLTNRQERSHHIKHPLHQLYCDFFGAKYNGGRRESDEPSSTSSL